METIRYSLIGYEDIAWGTGTFEVTLADGSVVAIRRIQPFEILHKASNVSVTTNAESHAVVFDTEGDNTSFGVQVSPSWNTTWWISGKATTGCTVNFGTPAPSGGTIDIEVRPDA